MRLISVLLLAIVLELAWLNIQVLVRPANAQAPRWEDPIPVVIVNPPIMNSSWGLGPSLANKVRVTSGGELIVTTR